MKNKFEKFPNRGVAATIAPGIFTALTLGYSQVCLAASPGQTTFPSAEAGSRALFQAVEHHDEQALIKILGAGEDLVSSDDPVQDKRDRQQFVQKYQEMHRLDSQPDGDTILYVGAENWPFPIPLVSRNGVWRFDPDAGRQEALLRQIGENEVTAIEVCRDLVLAENQSVAKDKADSAIATLLAEMEHSKSAVLFQAYNFRLLTDPGKAAQGAPKGRTGGLALVAFPAAYRQSGVMTFVVGQDGVVYQKDLGPDTATLAATMAEYHVDPTWTPVPTGP